MRIKKYVARDFKTAINQAKAELGSDAIILNTRQLKRNKLLEIFSPRQVEVTVAVDETLKVNTDFKRPYLNKKEGKSNAALLRPQQGETNNKKQNDGLIKELQQMKEMVSEIKDHMHEVGAIKGVKRHLYNYYQALISNNVNEDLAIEIINAVDMRLPEGKLGDEIWTRDTCLHVLEEYINNIAPIDTGSNLNKKLIFIVGPTGVGKTTSIAKLAANMTFVEKKDIALITLDTYRVSAADQLRTFAEIIGIPIRVVFNQADFKEALVEYNHKDIVFVDTAGRSPRNEAQMNELKTFINISKPHETILVLSVTTQTNDLIATYKQFEQIGIDKVIFTKLDETYSYGQILNTIHAIKRPVAYLSTGQNVPDDIEVPDSLHLATLLLRKDGLV